jgi:SNF2 family DNA or RNA helicase
VISLALILKHPAPQLPISGSDISALATAPAPSDERDPKWDMGLYVRASPGISKRGSILSRGTLVICPVSLVGQWIQGRPLYREYLLQWCTQPNRIFTVIAEAKSKLTDPGLLYPYHGQNRNRDANVLAKSAIVVTTYQVLASDDKYHRAKSSDPSSYCPPLEQVRWWRIICDEGHSLRQPNTARNRSISSLVADHKWLVTGTPVNTSIMDLKNQLKFIGIESIESMFNKICPNPRSRRRYEGNHSSPSKLLFFLRNVMMRHAQKQFYRGTKTTLMSLPAKTERSIEISLSPAERKEYNSLDSAAKTFYTEFKSSHLHELSSHYLKLSQKLTPMRVACSGGRTPLGDGHTDKDEDIDEGIPAARKKSEVQYSDFCFTAKFNVLIRELKRARDNDPTSKSLVFSQYNSTLNWLKQELPKHAFEFRTLSGSMSMKQRAKSLHDFQADPPTTIFLLSMRYAIPIVLCLSLMIL